METPNKLKKNCERNKYISTYPTRRGRCRVPDLREALPEVEVEVEVDGERWRRRWRWRENGGGGGGAVKLDEAR